MAKNLLYPRVEITTTAKKHSSRRPAVEDTTSILAMCITEKGPTELTAVHSLAEFIDVFGELEYSKNGQSALMIYNWLSNGGTAYVKRFVSDEYPSSTQFKCGDDILFSSKYAGKFYDELKIRFVVDAEDKFSNNTSVVTPEGTGETNGNDGGDGQGSAAAANEGGDETGDDSSQTTEETSTTVFTEEGRYTISIIHTSDRLSTTVEKFYRVPASKLIETLSESEYIEVNSGISLDSLRQALASVARQNSALESFDLETITSKVTVASSTSSTAFELEGKISSYCTSDDLEKDIGNKLMAPFELILGAGFSATTDSSLLDIRKIRDDVVVILDNYELSTNPISAPSSKNYSDNSPTGNDHSAIFDQYFKIYDNVFTGRHMFVTMTYFLSSLIPYNDELYGIQNPVAGLRRGILSGVLEIHDNFTSSEKNTKFAQRINYAEKTTRECAIMGNRTHDASTEDSYTALSFLNNVRTLERMKKEIERMAREYLFEFNDSYTLSQLSGILNKYITEWILNRTLNLGVVTVEKDPYSDEQIDIGLNVRFNGTVEVIHVDIVIE